jgi:hypothetical protein
MSLPLLKWKYLQKAMNFFMLHWCWRWSFKQSNNLSDVSEETQSNNLILNVIWYIMSLCLKHFENVRCFEDYKVWWKDLGSWRSERKLHFKTLTWKSCFFFKTQIPKKNISNLETKLAFHKCKKLKLWSLNMSYMKLPISYTILRINVTQTSQNVKSCRIHKKFITELKLKLI